MEYVARLSWKRQTADFAYDSYNRSHVVSFGGGQALPMSAAPEFKGEAARANPEELLVAALSSCHMLTFLAIAARKRLVVDAYEDDAVGLMTKNADGKLFVSHVTLRPRVSFAQPPPDDVVQQLHHQAHADCFIANSVRTQVTVEA
jgi:organic hydroperoxide reductase OsmC/OhrA